MAISITQSIQFDDATSTNSHVKSSISTAANSLLILAIADAGSSNGGVNAISDSATNTWTQIVTSSSAFVKGASIWATSASAAAITSYTIGLDASGPIQSQFYEVAGAGISDGSHAGTPSTGTSASSGAVTPVGTTDLAIGIVNASPAANITYSSNTFTAGAGTEVARAAKTGTIQAVTGSIILASAAAQTYSATLSTSSSWTSVIAIWRVAAPPVIYNQFNNYFSVKVGDGMSGTDRIR